MAFQVSPGVNFTEIDQTTVVPATSTSIGGYAGAFNWGPANSITTVSSEQQLAATFGAPTVDATLARSFLTAASFLKYGNNLKVIRAVGDSAKNAVVSGTAILIKNADIYDASYSSGQGSVGAWAAKYAGSLGNSLLVSVCPSATAYASWTTTIGAVTFNLASNFASAPGTSASATGAGSSNDEMHILVIDEDGAWTGTPGTVLEKFEYVSQASDALKTDGTSNYYKNVVNTSSKYIYWMDHDTNLTKAGQSIYLAQSFGGYNSNITNSLTGGVDSLPSSGNVVTALDTFKDTENVDVSLVFTAGDADGETTVAAAAIAVADFRRDAVAFVSPPLGASVNASSETGITTWATSLAANSSYAFIDSTALKVYDKYNDLYRWIPAAGHMAGLCARTDTVADAWFSPAGVSRGALLGVTKLAFNPSKAQRDTLFNLSINPIISTPGEGTILFGDKTALKKPSAFDAINVRRLFITLEKSITRASKAQLFEFNDEFTRAAFRNSVEPFLREVQGRRGITDFKVVCDETNNTGDIIDRNRFVGDIYVKPARAIRYVQLNFVATRTGVQFSELVGA
jgi:phage tail sheath protein FI